MSDYLTQSELCTGCNYCATTASLQLSAHSDTRKTDPVRPSDKRTVAVSGEATTRPEVRDLLGCLSSIQGLSPGNCMRQAQWRMPVTPTLGREEGGQFNIVLGYTEFEASLSQRS